MKLWTAQSPNVADALERNEEYVPDIARSSFVEGDKKIARAYEWMRSAMTSRIGPGPGFPVWNWPVSEPVPGPRELREAYGNVVIIVHDVPDANVVLSDFDAWHDVLNDRPVVDIAEWEAWETGPSPDEIHASEKVDTWSRIFRVSGKPYIQACTWSIEPSRILEVRR